ncbi:MAG TPA: hypothetical protein VGJ13_02270 [Pseudonocardiaceae bacterium]
MISSTVYNEIASEPTVLVALVVEQAIDEGFCVDLGQGQWTVMGLVTFVAKASPAEYQRKVDSQTLTNANTMLFKILATPEHGSVRWVARKTQMVAGLDEIATGAADEHGGQASRGGVHG